MADSSKIYDNNSICLTISPGYDDYKKISLNYLKDGVLTDLNVDKTNNYKYFLEFGDISSLDSKIISIPEYNNNNLNVTISNNELIFRISAIDSSKIMSLRTNIFNLVRCVMVEQNTLNETISEKQTLFTGRWIKKTYQSIFDEQEKIKNMETEISEKNQEIQELKEQILDMQKQNSLLEDEVSLLREDAKYKEMYEDLKSQVDAGNEYSGSSLEYDVKYVNINLEDKDIENKVTQLLETLNT